MHRFMLVALAAAGFVGTGLGFYLVILFFFLFPWDALALRRGLRRWRAERGAGAGGTR